MKKIFNVSSPIGLALLLQAGSVVADKPFVAADIKTDNKTSDCRIMEFVCATCGHFLDPEQWDKQNRYIPDVETCEQNKKYGKAKIEDD